MEILVSTSVASFLLYLQPDTLLRSAVQEAHASWKNVGETADCLPETNCITQCWYEQFNLASYGTIVTTKAWSDYWWINKNRGFPTTQVRQKQPFWEEKEMSDNTIDNTVLKCIWGKICQALSKCDKWFATAIMWTNEQLNKQKRCSGVYKVVCCSCGNHTFTRQWKPNVSWFSRQLPFYLYLQVAECRPSAGWWQQAGSSCEVDSHQWDQSDGPWRL